MKLQFLVLLSASCALETQGVGEGSDDVLLALSGSLRSRKIVLVNFGRVPDAKLPIENEKAYRYRPGKDARLAVSIMSCGKENCLFRRNNAVAQTITRDLPHEIISLNVISIPEQWRGMAKVTGRLFTTRSTPHTR